jgi:hypothetical protein
MEYFTTTLILQTSNLFGYPSSSRHLIRATESNDDNLKYYSQIVEHIENVLNLTYHTWTKDHTSCCVIFKENHPICEALNDKPRLITLKTDTELQSKIEAKKGDVEFKEIKDVLMNILHVHEFKREERIEQAAMARSLQETQKQEEAEEEDKRLRRNPHQRHIISRKEAYDRALIKDKSVIGCYVKESGYFGIEREITEFYHYKEYNVTVPVFNGQSLDPLHLVQQYLGKDKIPGYFFSHGVFRDEETYKKVMSLAKEKR